MTNIQNNEERNKSKNDVAWEKLFTCHNILQKIGDQGSFEITSEQINEVRESRLMAKFDQSVKLPSIFKENNLSILPITRKKYMLGHFDTHLKVNYEYEDVNNVNTIYVSFPNQIQSIDYTNLYSESLVINCAFNAGIIDCLFDEQCFHTLSGRMSTKEFDFKIRNLKDGSYYDLSVNGSQCEIDAGFESLNYLLIIEAKNYKVNDFLIRQLYYPYRLWKNKIEKHVIPILMTYYNSEFSFFIYKFEDDHDYNSIRLIEQKKYVIRPEDMSREEVSEIFATIKILEEPTDIPFPQADDFSKVVELLSLVKDNILTRDDIKENYDFAMRQVNYYTDAARYLGLIQKNNNLRAISFILTLEGESILEYGYKQKILSLIEKILEHKVFNEVFRLTTASGIIPEKKKFVKSCYLL